MDFECAKKRGIKTIWELGIPGKVAPFSSACILEKTIINCLEEKGIHI